MKSRASIWEVAKDMNSPHYVEVGDLFMSTANQIFHPEYLSGKISGVYIFFVLQGVTAPLKTRKVMTRSM